MDCKAIPQIYKNSKFWPGTTKHGFGDNSGSVPSEGVSPHKGSKGRVGGGSSNLNRNGFKDYIIPYSIRK